MKETIEWLVGIEKSAAKFYTEAALLFEKDQHLSHFLSELADDEHDHIEILTQAGRLIAHDHAANRADIAIDRDTRKKIEARVLKSLDLLKGGNITRDEVIDFTIKLELSEWNEIFTYVVNHIIKSGHRLRYTPAKIQQHKQKLEDFLRYTPEYRQQVKNLERMPDVWQGKILIIDDEEPILEMLTAIFEEKYLVKTAPSSERGIQMLNNEEFEVIILDINMPGINGIEFYQQVVAKNSGMRDHFLFFSGAKEHFKFLIHHNLRFLEKPVALSRIKQAVDEIIKGVINAQTH
jgi:CheY-like chemotaxis protein